ncbi:MAG TPA: signal peptidase II [Myxococcota bacterium]|nr:signal peptidase II [Myxococcota bacterium]
MSTDQTAGGSPVRAARRPGWPYLAVLAGAWVVADQASKWWANRFLAPRPGGRLELVSGLFDLDYAHNPGAAWSLLVGAPAGLRRALLLTVSLLAAAALVWMYQRLVHAPGSGAGAAPHPRLMATALALVLGGAAGNFIDRAIDGYVVDFFRAHWFEAASWPTFNVADIGITVGVAALLVQTLWSVRPEARAAEGGPGQSLLGA